MFSYLTRNISSFALTLTFGALSTVFFQFPYGCESWYLLNLLMRNIFWKVVKKVMFSCGYCGTFSFYLRFKLLFLSTFYLWFKNRFALSRIGSKYLKWKILTITPFPTHCNNKRISITCSCMIINPQVTTFLTLVYRCSYLMHTKIRPVSHRCR